MCTIVFLGSSRPFCMGPRNGNAAVAPAEVASVPTALKHCSHVAVLRDWRFENANCSCVFIEKSLPWDVVEEDAETQDAFAGLRDIAAEYGKDLIIFGCDDVDAGLAPNVFCKAAPQHLEAGGRWFNIPFGGGEPPRVLIEVDPELDAPIKPETLDVL